MGAGGQNKTKQNKSAPSLTVADVLQAVFRFDTGALLEQVGTGKESLNFMKRRIQRLAAQWACAARRLDDKLRSHRRDEKRVSAAPRICPNINIKLHTRAGP